MGVVLNPVAYRVGYKYSWRDAWYAHRLTYSVFVHDVLAFKTLMHFLFFRYFSYKRNPWLYSHVTVFIFNNRVFVNLFLYDGNDVQLYYDIARRYKKIAWRRMNAISGWFKSNLLDRKSRLKRFHFFTRTLRFFYDFLVYEDINLVLRRDRRTIFNLTRLKNNKDYYEFFDKRYSFYKKGTDVVSLFNVVYKKNYGGWMPWEELRAYRLPFKNMVYDMNFLSTKWWAWRYHLFNVASIKKIRKREQKHIKQRIKKLKFVPGKMSKKRYFRKFPKRLLNKKRQVKDLILFNTQRRFTKKYLLKKNLYSRYVRSNNRMLFIFLSFFNKLFINTTQFYDVQVFTRRWMRKFLRFYVYFFLRKSALKIYGKLLEYIALFLNLNFDVKVYVLNNSSLGAGFISRFIAIGLRNKYDYLDMIIPIRKNLRKQMYVKNEVVM